MIFLIDCGRMMLISSGLSLLDHTLNAALMLSWVASASRRGGLLCFSDGVRNHVTAGRHG